MDSNLEECPTGILVDFEETTITISSDCKKECNGGLSDSNADLLKHGTEELSFGCQTVLVNGGFHKIASGNCLGAELNNLKDEVCFSKIEWRSPSPTTMNMIAREASRIVDQLHTTLETSLWEEECSLSFVSEDEHLDDASYKESSCNEMLEKCCNIVEEGSCFKKENSSVCLLNLVMEESKVKVDNSVYKENKSTTQTDLSINTFVENENVVSSKEKYATANNCTLNSSENNLNFEETVSTKKNCVTERSTTNSLNGVLFEENKICCLIENSSVSTEKSSFFSEVKSNVTTEFGSVDLFNAENISSTEESCIPNQVNGSSFTKKNSSALHVLSNSVSTEVDSGSSTSTKEGNELMVMDSIASTEEINASNEIDGNAPNEVDVNALNEIDGNAPNEVDVNALNEIDGNAANLVDGNAANEVDGNFPNEVDGNVPNEVDGNVPNEVDGNVPNEVKSKISTADNCDLIEVESHASSNGILCADENNYIYIRDTCNGTKEISKYSEISNTVEVGNLGVFDGHKQKLPAQTSKSNKDKCMENTPLTLKSKFKFFKTPSLKSPFKSKFEEKENSGKGYKQNSLSEKNLSKIGQVFSAKGVLSASNTKGSTTLASNSSIKTPLNKSSMGNVPLGRENKTTLKVSQDEANQKPQTFDTPLKRISLAKCQPPSNGKIPLGKSYSLRAKTPNTGTTIRRSSSFQTRQAENAYHFKKEKSFIGESRLTNFNSGMSFAQAQPIGNKLRFETPSKIGIFLPKSTTNPTAIGTPFSSKAKLSSKELQSCKPLFGSAIRTTMVPNQSVPEVVGLKRPASTTSKTRFTSRLELPSPLPKMLNDNLSRRLFPDSTPLKRRV